MTVFDRHSIKFQGLDAVVSLLTLGIARMVAVVALSLAISFIFE
jgi:hypothetical protein